ncbi:MAG: hypothetical protein V2I97_10610 [Desulfococcaceae bacterium]|jgi:hypothetical protein|nr:hypothetical protein [Desulfococcaceae bacterium]
MSEKTNEQLTVEMANLKVELHYIANLYDVSLKLYEIDPAASCIMARKLLETICIQLYSKEVQNYPKDIKLTETSLSNLNEMKLPKDVLNNLRKMKNRVYSEEDEFFDDVKEAIGKDAYNKHKSLIMSYIETERINLYRYIKKLGIMKKRGADLVPKNIHTEMDHIREFGNKSVHLDDPITVNNSPIALDKSEAKSYLLKLKAIVNWYVNDYCMKYIIIPYKTNLEYSKTDADVFVARINQTSKTIEQL